MRPLLLSDLLLTEIPLINMGLDHTEKAGFVHRACPYQTLTVDALYIGFSDHE